MIDRRRVMTTGGHEYVDFGLPSGTLWAKTNVGAETETDYGNYYAYGKGASTWANEINYNGMENPLAASADTATQTWGSPWHMPTESQCLELRDNTNYTWDTINGINGGKFIHKTDTSRYIFIPASGYYNYRSGGLYGVNSSYATAWTSTPESAAWARTFNASMSQVNMGSGSRMNGYSVRPVIG